ncbi:MAG: hypothetical protein K0R46_2205, partial [Herbinix sp.]|nr:hypothetical protein [Herbinix sp.]
MPGYGKVIVFSISRRKTRHKNKGSDENE